MATDINQNRLNHMRTVNYDQEQGLQQILQPSAVGQLPPVEGDDQPQQVVPRKTIYTRAELLCRGQTTTENTVHLVAAPQTPLSPSHEYATSMPKMPSRKRTYMDLLAQLPQTGSKMPNWNLTRMGTVIDIKQQFKMSPNCLQQRQEQQQPVNKEPSRKLTRMQTVMDLKKEEPCENKKEDPCEKKKEPYEYKMEELCESKKEEPCENKEEPCEKKKKPYEYKMEELCKSKKEENKEEPSEIKKEPCEIKKTPNDQKDTNLKPYSGLGITRPKVSRIPVLSRSRYREGDLEKKGDDKSTKQNPIRMRTEIPDLRTIRHKDSKIPVLDKSWMRKCILKEREEQRELDNKNRFYAGITGTSSLSKIKSSKPVGGLQKKWI